MSVVESVGRGRYDKAASSSERIMKPHRDNTFFTNVDRNIRYRKVSSKAMSRSCIPSHPEQLRELPRGE